MKKPFEETTVGKILFVVGKIFLGKFLKQQKFNKTEKAESLRIAEAVKLAKAPIKEQLTKWVESFELPKTDLYNDTELEIKEKFEAFKKWSLTQVNNL